MDDPWRKTASAAIGDVDVDLVPYDDCAPQEDELAEAFVRFMQEAGVSSARATLSRTRA